MGYNCLFTDVCVTVFRRSDDSITFKGVLDGHLYLVDFNHNKAELDTCLMSHPILEGQPNANHVRARISNSRTQQLHN
jgi:hypothetical protein